MNTLRVFAVIALLSLSLETPAQVPLSYGFDHPQDSARTKVWWFHGETVGTHEGITADLEAFKRQGVGGVVYYDQVHGKGEGAFSVFSPSSIDITPYVRKGSNRLKLRMANSLWNRLVGDVSLPEQKRICRQTHDIAKPNDTLVSSGMSGRGAVLVKRKRNSP